MTRVKRGTIHTRKRKRMTRKAKGHLDRGSSAFRLAKQVTTKAGQHAYTHRRTKKRTNRRLWITKLNAAVRAEGMTYSAFIALLKKKKVDLDRKVLSEMAEKHPKVFKQFITELQK
ncbi:50S ribosomal protein L20 [Patescibacteria group bacterium]